ncbi:protein-glutamate O-methyltransferase CheR [Deltaproteobacteria bacterium TL4]
MFKLEQEEFQQIKSLIYDYSGLFFDERKHYFVEKRIGRRIKEGEYSSFQDYYRALKFAKDTEEMANLIELLTTNETYFFRHIPQLESFVEEALPLVLAEKRKQGDKTLSIWSAACSSGEEIYTIAILLREQLRDFSGWTIHLMATDIDRKILKKAQEGIYDTRSVKDVSKPLLERYFKPLPDGRYEIHNWLKTSIEFKYLNLVDRVEMRKQRKIDFVFCRNVLIYFDDPSRKQVINSFYGTLNPNGFIFLGHSESVGRLSAAFKLVKFKKSLSYQK